MDKSTDDTNSDSGIGSDCTFATTDEDEPKLLFFKDNEKFHQRQNVNNEIRKKIKKKQKGKISELKNIGKSTLDIKNFDCSIHNAQERIERLTVLLSDLRQRVSASLSKNSSLTNVFQPFFISTISNPVNEIKSTLVPRQRQEFNDKTRKFNCLLENTWQCKKKEQRKNDSNSNYAQKNKKHVLKGEKKTLKNLWSLNFWLSAFFGISFVFIIFSTSNLLSFHISLTSSLWRVLKTLNYQSSVKLYASNHHISSSVHLNKLKKIATKKMATSLSDLTDRDNNEREFFDPMFGRFRANLNKPIQSFFPTKLR